MEKEIPGRAFYKDREIVYSLKYSRRRSVGITICPDLSVVVRAPKGLSPQKVEGFVFKKGGWILKKQGELERNTVYPESCGFCDEAPFLYLGRVYRLAYGRGKKRDVLLEDSAGGGKGGGRLVVILKENDPLPGNNPTCGATEKLVKREISAFYKREARRIISGRFEFCGGISRTVGIEAGKEFDLRKMKRRWGSCSKSGRLLFNSLLICAPLACVDYVILHELCHRKEQNHRAGFYKLLESVLPDWKTRRAELKRIGVPYF